MVMGTIAASLVGGPRFDRAVQEHIQEVSTFARNKVEYPYNLLRDFDDPSQDAERHHPEQPRAGPNTKEGAPRMLTHKSGNIVAYRLSAMASLERIVTEWSSGSLVRILPPTCQRQALTSPTQ